MKLFITSFITLIIMSCTTKNSVEKSRSQISKISLTERTRGTNRIFTIENGKLENSTNGNITSKQLTENDWLKISTLAEKIDIENISKLIAPSTNRYSDAALASTVIIYKDGNEYQSSGFDSGNPPVELKDLYTEIQRVIETKKSR